MSASPNLLSRDACYTLGVIKPCYSVETTGNSSKFQGNIKGAAPTQPTTHLDQSKCKVIHLYIVKMMELKWSNRLDLPKSASGRMKFEKTPLTKQMSSRSLL